MDDVVLFMMDDVVMFMMDDELNGNGRCSLELVYELFM